MFDQPLLLHGWYSCDDRLSRPINHDLSPSTLTLNPQINTQSAFKTSTSASRPIEKETFTASGQPGHGQLGMFPLLQKRFAQFAACCSKVPMDFLRSIQNWSRICLHILTLISTRSGINGSDFDLPFPPQLPWLTSQILPGPSQQPPQPSHNYHEMMVQ